MIFSNSQQGLTTTKAPFIELARQEGRLFICQPYELYSPDNQEAWRQLFKILLPCWEKFANDKFLDGIKKLQFQPARIPRLEEVNQFLAPMTGFQAKGVSGYITPFLFFDCLKRREFPTTITIRDTQSLSYLPEPDIFHDIAGHVPMHTDKTFADVLAKFGSLAHIAAERHRGVKDTYEREAKISSNIQALSRFFWFTVEFGLMRQNGKLCAYGSGLLSSAGELEHSVKSLKVQRASFQLEWIINQSFKIDHFQPLLFVIESFEQLYEEVNRLEEWLIKGKLDHVVPGGPQVDQEDLKAFLLNKEN
ncbi:MAG: phenylalanine 4-monooxygenase [Parachlamydiaceae bacterium]|nr:phenylalanine 4-monooxygenase [Parachlamydiaceae bacterium]